MTAYIPLGQTDTSCLMSHSLGSETARQDAKKRDNTKNKSGTSPLKLLAYKVLRQYKEQDKNRTKVKNSRDKAPQKKTVLSHLVSPCFDSEKPVSRIPVVDEATPLFRDTMLILNHNGKPESCIHCGRWQRIKDRPWWVGVCDISGEAKTNKSHCDIPSYEEAL